MNTKQDMIEDYYISVKITVYSAEKNTEITELNARYLDDKTMHSIMDDVENYLKKREETK